MDIDKKTPGEAIKGAGARALPLIFPRSIANGKNQVRNYAGGSSSVLDSFYED